MAKELLRLALVAVLALTRTAALPAAAHWRPAAAAPHPHGPSLYRGTIGWTLAAPASGPVALGTALHATRPVLGPCLYPWTNTYSVNDASTTTAVVAVGLVFLAGGLHRLRTRPSRTGLSLRASAADDAAAADAAATAMARLFEELNRRPQPILQPKTPTGEFLRFVLEQYPHLFEQAVRRQLQDMCDAQAHRPEARVEPNTEEVVLYQRIREIHQKQDSQALEDVLYFSVLRTFTQLGLSPIRPEQLRDTAAFVHSNLTRLLPQIHSGEEREVVHAHLKQLLGPMGLDLSFMGNTTVRMFKYHAFQIFASSLLFGYFLRHTYRRFALARSAGLVPKVLSHEEKVEMLKNLYERPDAGAPEAAAPGGSTRGRAPSLKEHLAGHDEVEPPSAAPQFHAQETAAVVQEYLNALFGDVPELMQQINEVVNEPHPVTSPEEYTERMAAAAAMDRVAMLDIGVADLHRLVLEAVTFGTVLKDAEGFVELVADRPLLTPLRPAPWA